MSLFRHTVTHFWTTADDFALGTFDGTVWDGGTLRFAAASATRIYRDPFNPNPSDQLYQQASWTSHWVALSFAPRQFLMSWNAKTPPGTWVELVARLGDEQTRTNWCVLGRWCASDLAAGGEIQRTSVTAQQGDHFSVDQDVFKLSDTQTYTHFQIGVRLLRRVGTHLAPTLTLVSASARDEIPETWTVSQPSGRPAVLVDVPPLSQQLHRDRYPQWGGGGQTWCSPTSVSMVLQYWDLGPTKTELAWVDAGLDPVVVHAARNCWDYAYHGAGNWPFCAAYAAQYQAVAYATWLNSLTDAEDFLRLGIPLVASVAHHTGELDGAGYETGGHLLVIVGFTADGDVICNDPASHHIASNDEVRTTYRRDQFERAWLNHSGGGVYVIVPAERFEALVQPK